MLLELPWGQFILKINFHTDFYRNFLFCCIAVAAAIYFNLARTFHNTINFWFGNFSGLNFGLYPDWTTCPQNRLTEGFAWANTGAGLGIALASAISGWVIDNSGAQVAFWVVSAAGLLTFAITLITYRDLKRADSRSAKSA